MRHPFTHSPFEATSWLLIALLATTSLLLGTAAGFGIVPHRAALPVLGVGLLTAGAVWGRRHGRERLTAAAIALLQMTLFTILGVVLAYLLAARAGPVWDMRLTVADARLGLHWPAILRAVDTLPASLLLLAGIAYHSLTLQMVATVLLLAWSGHLDRLRQSVAAAILAGVVTILVSGLMPAMGNLFDPDQYRHLWPSVAWRDQGLIAGLRDGSIRQLDLSQMTGIVSFPSYHASLPMILVWALRPLHRIRVPAAGWAGLTVLATPLFGGHYAVDVLAGLLLALIAIAATGRLPQKVLDVRHGCPNSTKPVYAAAAPVRDTAAIAAE